MTEYDFSRIKFNNPYKEQCEYAEKSLNTEHYLEATTRMGIILEKITKELIRSFRKKIVDIEYSTQSERISILKNNKIINYKLSNDFHKAREIRNDMVHGDIPENYFYASLMKNHFLRIMQWYDVTFVPLEIDPKFKLKQYLNKSCNDTSIMNIIKVEIDEGKITENHQIIKRIKEELIKYVESINIELGIKEKIIKGISSGIIKNRSQIEEKITGLKKDPIIGVANIVNTENRMKYTIQSTDIDKELKENMEKLQNNTHENKQLQEDYNKYGPSSFTTETVTICKNKAQSQIVKEDEIIFNANKSYNYNRKEEVKEEQQYTLKFYQKKNGRCQVTYKSNYLCSCENNETTEVEKYFNEHFNGENIQQVSDELKKIYNKKIQQNKNKELQ